MILEQIIKQDILSLLKFISIKFNIPINLLLERYIPKLKIYKRIKRNRNNIRKPSFKFPNKYRCLARCWGGKDSVKYIVKDNTWVYGSRCKRRKYGLTNYCQTHLKQVKINGFPKHGDFNTPPPHNHYLKYKNKIEKNLNIK